MEKLIILVMTIEKKINAAPNGRNEEFHKEPSLHLVERPKKKMRIEAWANVYSDNAFVVHDTKEIADSFGKNKIERIACVKLTSEEFEC